MTPPPPAVETVGVLGGTFDPVHVGHLHVASSARGSFGLGRVLLVPCARPPHKPRADVTDASHRLAMLALAVAGREGLEIATLELEREGPSYTIDTLRALQDGSPPLRPLLVVGWDAFLDLPTWHRHAELLEEFDLVAVRRPEESPLAKERSPDADLAARILDVPPGDGSGARLLEARAARGGRVYRLSVPPVPVSSRRIRALAEAGEPLSGLVPEEVARYIQAHRLYGRKEEPR